MYNPIMNPEEVYFLVTRVRGIRHFESSNCPFVPFLITEYYQSEMFGLFVCYKVSGLSNELLLSHAGVSGVSEVSETPETA